MGEEEIGNGIIDFRQRKFAQVTKAVLDDEVVIDKPVVKLVYAVLCSYADNTTKQSWPSIKKIAKKSCCSENTARRAVRSLKELGLIDVKARYGPDLNQTSNAYILCDVPEDLSTLSPHYQKEEGGSTK